MILDVGINMPPCGSLTTLVAIGPLTAMHYASYVKTRTALNGTTHRWCCCCPSWNYIREEMKFDLVLGSC
jgi:hypothetical protein